MKKNFVDTSAFAALADQDDDNHAKAVIFNQTINKTLLISSNYVLDELYTLLLMNTGYRNTLKFKQQIDRLIEKKLLRIIWISEEIATETWQIFEKFNIDKQWSFTDCTSYIIMQKQEIIEVFTFDHHFSQMGFNRLPIS